MLVQQLLDQIHNEMKIETKIESEGRLIERESVKKH